jgi:phosphatidate cytidylyltransferase
VPYVIAVAGGTIVATHEVFSMLAGAGRRPLWPLGVVLAVALVVSAAVSDARLLPAVLVIGVLGALFWLMRRPDPDGALLDWAVTLAPALYVGLTFSYAVALRNAPDGDGLLWVLIALICTWACDITAFFIGRRWGKARLAPRISPGKSVEGAVGGVVATVAVAVALGPLLTAILTASGLGLVTQPSLVRLAGLGLVIAVCAIAGDLMESFVKRQCGAKDSSGLIPGHGGVLDRIDSMLVAVVGAYFYVVTTG